jgi:hypothetical protein
VCAYALYERRIKREVKLLNAKRPCLKGPVFFPPNRHGRARKIRALASPNFNQSSSQNTRTVKCCPPYASGGGLRARSGRRQHQPRDATEDQAYAHQRADRPA